MSRGMHIDRTRGLSPRQSSGFLRRLGFGVWSLMLLGALGGCGDAKPPGGSSAPLAGPPADVGSATIATTPAPEVSVATTWPWPEGEWHRWGGPDGYMRAPAGAWDTQWESNPPKVLWRAEVGTGFSSFTLAKGRLFTMGRDGENDLIVALNAETGEELWRVVYPVPLFDNLHEGGPGATPVLVDEDLLTVSRNGAIKRLRQSDGTVVWEKNLVELTGIQPPEWGYTTSPLVWNGMAIYESGSIVALDALTGETRWMTESAAPGYGSPVHFQLGNRDLIASVNNAALMVVDGNSGQVVAQTPWETQYATTAATPTVVGKRLFVSTGYSTGCASFDLETQGLVERYRSTTMRNHMNACVLIDGLLYGVDGNSHAARTCRLVCMDWQTGEEKWSHRGWGCGSVVGCGDRLLVLSDTGTLVGVRATGESYQEFGQVSILEGKCWTVPIVLGNRLFARNAAGSVVSVELPAKP